MSVTWKDPSHFHLMPQTIIVSFFTTQIADNLMYEAITYLQLLPLSSLLIISISWGIVKVRCFLLPVLPCLFISGPSEAITIAQWPQWGSDNANKSHRFIMDTGSYVQQNFFCLGTTFLKFQIIRRWIKGILPRTCTHAHARSRAHTHIKQVTGGDNCSMNTTHTL